MAAANCLYRRRRLPIQWLGWYRLGLIAYVEEDDRIFLGWNIRLKPERWEITEHDDGAWDAQILVREDEVEDHNDTDSDNYINGDSD